MERTVLALSLGFLSPFVFILGAEPFEQHGGNSVGEVVAGSGAVALYLAISGFLVVRKNGAAAREGHSAGGLAAALLSERPSLVAMAFPLLASFFLILILESLDTALSQGVPMLAAGCIGIFAGALAAILAPAPRSRRQVWPTVVRVASGLFFAAALILALVAAPAAARDVSPAATPENAATGFRVVAILHLVLAGLLLWRPRASALRAVLVVSGLIFGLLLLAIAADFTKHGPAMREAAVALFLCAGGDFAVGAGGLIAAIAGGTDAISGSAQKEQPL